MHFFEVSSVGFEISRVVLAGYKAGIDNASQSDTWDPFPKWIVDLSQIVGAVGTLVALGAAVYAIWKSNIDLARERRIAHELEVLRSMADVHDLTPASYESYVSKVYLCLLMLPEADDLPLTRTALDVYPSAEGVRQFNAKYQNSPPLSGQKWGEHGYLSKRLMLVGLDDTIYQEVIDSIERRLKPMK